MTGIAEGTAVRGRVPRTPRDATGKGEGRRGPYKPYKEHGARDRRHGLPPGQTILSTANRASAPLGLHGNDVDHRRRYEVGAGIEGVGFPVVDQRLVLGRREA